MRKARIDKIDKALAAFSVKQDRRLRMAELADYCGLTHDGGADDDRLFCETMHVLTTTMSEEEYDKMEDDLDGYHFKGKGFEVYAWNDCSGYKYWHDNGEDNYIQVTVAIKDHENVDAGQIKKAAEIAYAHFNNKYGRY